VQRSAQTKSGKWADLNGIANFRHAAMRVYAALREQSMSEKAKGSSPLDCLPNLLAVREELATQFNLSGKAPLD
jgi:hypothetical protein